MENKPNVINFLSNNGVTSNLLAGGLFALPSLFVRQIAGCVGEAWATIIVAVSFTVLIGFVFSWINRREGVIAKRMGFARLLPDGFDRDKYIEEKEISAAHAEMPRQALQDELLRWGRLDAKSRKSGRAARLCLVCGERSLGRQTLACAGVWMESEDCRVYSCKSSFVGNAQQGFADAKEWEEAFKFWIRSFSKGKRYLVILSDVQQGDWLDAVRRLVEYSSDCRRSVLFLVKLAPGIRAHAISQREPNAENETSWSIDPLTVLQCGQFVRKYAERAHWEDRLENLQKRFENVDCASSFDRWCFACSGGRPKRLVAFLKNEGGSSETLTSCLIKDIKDNESAGFSAGECSVVMSFLWCLCLEKARVAQLNANGQVDVMQIARRLGRNLGELEKLATVFLGDSLCPRISVSTLDEYFAVSTARIPEEMVIASLGAGEAGVSFQAGIAVWLQSVIADGAELPYVPIIVDAISNALQCGGAYVAKNGDLNAAFDAIEGLRKAFGSFAGQPDADMLDRRAEMFFSALRTELKNRIMATCISGLGFLEDESVVRMVSVVLEKCMDEQEFLSYYHSALQVFGMTICNPVGLAAVKRMREIAARKLMPEKVDATSLAGVLPDFLCTVLLCVFRAPNLSQTEEGSLFEREDDFVKLLEKVPHKACETIGRWLDLIDALDNDDTWNMSRSMSAIMDGVDGDQSWNGMYVMFALIAVYMNDQCGEVKDFLWPRILKGLDVCRFSFDGRNIIRDLARFPVIWRRAYCRYVVRKCSPWAISAQLEDAHSQLKDLESLTKMDVLRYLPELVRHFALCVQAKSRGDKRFVDVLHAGWRKIQSIAECEDWFNVVNRRSRYWVINWSGQILRDAMSEEEREKYFVRFQTLCEEISDADDVWYHIKLLGTCSQLACDPLLLQQLQDQLEWLVFDRYGSPDDGLLRRIDRKCVFDAWFDCALMWFNDYLTVAKEKMSPLDVLRVVLAVIYSRSVGLAPEEVLSECIRTYRDEGEKALECVYETPKFMDQVLCAFSIDWSNREASGIGDVNCFEFVQLLKASEEMQVILKDRLDVALQDDDQEDCQFIVRFIFSIYVNSSVSDDFANHTFLSLFRCALLASKRLIEIGKNDSLMVVALEHVRQNVSDNDVLQEAELAYQAAIDAYIAEVREAMPSDDVDVSSDDAWLNEIWNCPPMVLQRMPDDVGIRIYEHLHRILLVYSECWLDELKSDWFYAVLCVFTNISLTHCPEELFSFVEKLVLSGRFAQDCSATECDHSRIIPLMSRLLEERVRREGNEAGANFHSQYCEYWRTLKHDVWGECTKDQLSPQDRACVDGVEKALSEMRGRK